MGKKRGAKLFSTSHNDGGSEAAERKKQRERPGIDTERESYTKTNTAP